VRRACESLRRLAAESDVVVISHVSPIKAAVAWALGAGEGTAWHMYLSVASICRISVGLDGPVLQAFNDTSHLNG
ncbi:MAG: histidine phosphatase family protein, partial [Acidimicrobiales bacterium]